MMRTNSLELRTLKRISELIHSQWENNVNKFYREGELPPNTQPQFTLTKNSGAFSQPNLLQGSVYRKNEAAFFGEKHEEHPDSRGSIFQKNAAQFYGYETPKSGERPYIVPSMQPMSQTHHASFLNTNVIFVIIIDAKHPDGPKISN